MARCSGCGGDRCSCVIRGGANVSVTGAGTLSNPYIVESSGGSGASVPSGTIMMYGGAVAPAGWLLADGSHVNRTTYATLFGVLGTAYGAGDGSTTFALPNLSGRFPIGAAPGLNRGLTGGSFARTLTVANLPSHIHSVPQHTHTVPQHNHSINHNHTASSGPSGAAHTHSGSTSSTGSHTHSYVGTGHVQINAGFGAGVNVRYDNTVDGTGAAGAHTHTFTTGNASAVHTHGVTVQAHSGNSGLSASSLRTGQNNAGNTGAAGSGAAFDITPPFLAVTFIIKA